MRIFLPFFVFFLFTIGSYAQKAVLHTSGDVKFFSGTSALVNAYAAATTGDTIYLSGGGFTSPGTIDKGLRLYGAGHYPDSTQATYKTILNGNTTLSENADGMYMEGFELNGYLYTTSNNQVDQFTMKYCLISGDVNIQGSLTTPSKNWIFINCVIKGTVYLTNGINIAIYNSLLANRIVSSYGNTLFNNILMFNYIGTGGY
nr:hypothetical protein [Prolixibacteraceae bacterium]